MWFSTLDEAKAFFDMLRFNRGADAGATVRGPEKQAWQCERHRWSMWTEITGDRDRLIPEGATDA